MEITYIINSIFQNIAVSLGVGCSTVAIMQFFVAIKNGKIEDVEKKLMAVVYLVLRVAMGVVLLTTIIQASLIYFVAGSLAFISPFLVAVWVMIVVLFANAIGMTKHWIPSTLGPAIQAGTWYTLGILFALIPLGLIGFGYLQFILAYAGIIFLALALVNATMAHMKK